MRYTIAILAILSFASCKKEHICECKTKDGKLNSTSTYKYAKKDAQKFETLCKGQEVGYNGTKPSEGPHTCVLN